MKQFIAVLAAGIAMQLGVHAQSLTTTDTLQKGIRLEEVIISATNFSEKSKNIAQKIEVISARTIALANAQNTGDLLINTGKIFVQKSQQGGSSPVIRGFEASRVLLVIDGVRLNNAIYRSGHLQNIITTDQNSLSRLEIMYGPSSAIYGSDALGGAIHMITKGPVLSGSKKSLFTGTAFSRYSSVNEEKTFHADASIAGKKWGWLQAYNFSDFGDMRMGSNYPDKYPGFGQRDSFIVTHNNTDEIVANTDNRVQKFSGYRQWDITQKLLFKPTANSSHLLNVQLSNSTNVPRYDRLQDIRNRRLRYAQWFYGPQKRLLTAYEFTTRHAGFFDELKANINFQDIEESRQTREFRRFDRFDSRKEKVKVWGATLSGRIDAGANEIVTGLDAQLNDVKSGAYRQNLLTGVKTSLDTRYPDGKNKLNSFAFFAQHIYKFGKGKWVLNDGLRLQYIHLNSNVIDNSFFNLPQTSITQNNWAVTGNIGLVHNAASTTIKANVSTGFRAPNIDDLAKIFESSTAAKQVVVPNANLKPEYTYNADITLVQTIAGRVTLEATGFYTLFRNAIVKAPYRLNGQDSILYNGVMSQVLASQNANKANLYGFTATLSANICHTVSVNSTVSYTKGYFLTDNSKASTVYEKQADGSYKLVSKKVSQRPLDHIPPVVGRTGIVFKNNWLNTELFALYNGWKRLENYNPDGEDNAQYATAHGMPAWFTLNWRASFTLHPKLQLQAGIENITDRNYRYFASGFSAGGRNCIIALRANW
jgi:hemoglobin/transferrin/lactoferrin receptor protein